MRVRYTLIIMALMLPLATNSNAELKRGTRVRVKYLQQSGEEYRLRWAVGTFAALEDADLLLAAGRGGDFQAIDRENIRRVDLRVRTSQRGRGAVAGASIGAIVGMILGGLASSDSHGFVPAGAAMTTFGVTFGAVGAGFGALLAPGEQWREVHPSDYLPGYRHVGYNLSLAIPF